MAAATVTPIAVIGMACRLPGGIDSPEQLWEALLRGDDLVTEIPADRWDADEFYDPEPGVPGRSVSQVGRVPRRRRRLRLRVLRHRRARGHRDRPAAPAAAGDRPGRPSNMPASTRDTRGRLATGVFVGLTHDDYQLLTADAGAARGSLRIHRHRFSMASGRIAYALGLHGPAITVDTACSSGLIAMHMACRSLHDGESDLALAGGVIVMLEPRKSACGFGAGHAVAHRALPCVRRRGRRLRVRRGLRDGVAQAPARRACATATGSWPSSAARPPTRTATPSTSRRRRWRRRSRCTGRRWRRPASTPATVGMVEAHGTGTPVGDPIEYTSLADGLRHRRALRARRR